METLSAQESFDSWNVPDSDGDTPIMLAFKEGQTEIAEILFRSSRVDLSCRDEEGWSLVFRAIQRNKLGKKMSSCFGSENIIISVQCRSGEDDSLQTREAFLRLQPGPHC